MAQMLVEAGKLDANFARARDMVRQAARAGCRFVVLPEVMDLGWDQASAYAHAQPIPGPTSEAIAALARENDIYIVSGLTERAGEQVFNAAVLASP
jgi:predicted amidohydrolase